MNNNLGEFAARGIDFLREDDPELFGMLEREHRRQTNSLVMVAASSIADPSVLACESMVVGNVTTEGYPGARFHAGCEFADEIENLAITRAKAAFKAQYANVQPHSGTSANQIVIFSLLKAGDTILGLDLNSGGHLTHGSRASVSGQYFNSIGYGLDNRSFIDYDQVHAQAREFRPKLIICGASAYPRAIDFKRFRRIADEVGAFLLADISHIAGLVVAGEHESPVDQAHFTTTSTYKQLFGPRGGLIFMGKDHSSPAPDQKHSLSEMIQRAVFPFFQGTPHLNTIAAKARALSMVMAPEFKSLARRIVENSKDLARCFIYRGYRVLTGGTDNHLVLIDVLARGLTGLIAERALEECNIIVNKNRIAGDKKSALVTSGIRLGANSLAFRGMTSSDMNQCAELVDKVLSSVRVLGERDYMLDDTVRESVRSQVEQLCSLFPIPRYPLEGLNYEEVIDSYPIPVSR